MKLCKSSLGQVLWAAFLTVSTAIPISEVAVDTDNERTLVKSHKMLAAPPLGSALGRGQWSVTCDSEHSHNPCQNAIDGNNKTFWHTAYSSTSTPTVPHTITLNLGSSQVINGISALPRQDGSNHGFIAEHSVYVSQDGTNWGSPVAFGNWYNDSTKKFSNFEPVTAQYVRLTAQSEASGRPWTSLSELNVYQASQQAIGTTGTGKWGPTIDFPIVPVAAAVEPTSGKIIVWSSYKDDDFNSSPGGMTLTAEYDGKTVSSRLVQNTQHDMFCPGISMDTNGHVIVTGGNDAERTSIFDSASDSWISGPDMKISRGYQASATCSDGRIFTLGGSWSGGIGGKNGEIYDPDSNEWTLLSGAPVKPILTNDPQGTYRADNHGWFFGWKDQFVFHAGPSTAMNWYSTTGNGGVTSAGKRQSAQHGADPDSMCGNAVMFDATKGKILTLGGSPAYQGKNSTNHAHIITLGDAGSQPAVTYASNGMYYARIFANAVPLPDGSVFVTGGQNVGIPFSDSTPVLTPEIYYPDRDTFYKQTSNSIPRVYHSIGLLLPDATVLSGGGGLCGGCSTNHFDAQIFTPQYLLNDDGSLAIRPVIKSVNTEAFSAGDTLSFTTDSAIQTASLIRYGGTTHTVNTDQRRVPLTLQSHGNSYSAVLPRDNGILLPGYWMLFVMNGDKVPSVASTIQIIL